MKSWIPSMLLGAAAVSLGASSAFAADAAGMLPGDTGKPLEGIPNACMAILVDASGVRIPCVPNAGKKGKKGAPAEVRSPGVNLALKAAQAIASVCQQYKLGVAVLDAKGRPILVYIPDGSNPGHSYTAIRKAYSAITFQADSITLVEKSQHDASFADQVRQDPNLMAFGGGVLLKVGDEIVGAIGVSGAEPGHHDDECANIGRDAIKDQLQ